MKYLIIPFLFLMACSTEVSSGPNYAIQVKHTTVNPLLEGIQEKIYNSFVQGLINKSDSKLIAIDQQLRELQKENKQNLLAYWRGYTKYYHSIYFLQQKDAKNAEKRIDEGIEILGDIEQKNSEDYALLAMLQSFSIQFKGMKAMFISQRVSKNVKAAMTIDAENLRAYYVGGSSDYYTPEKYGGGKKAEEYLKKAISLPSQKVKNAYLPSWGKEEAYEMLVKFYIKKERFEDAKKYYQEGIANFPQSYLLNQLAPKLVGK